MRASSDWTAVASRRLIVACVASVVLMSATLATAAPAKPIAPDKVPVLLVDGGLGDAQYYVKYWLGTEEPLAVRGGIRLLTSKAAVWWKGAGAPDTYLLTASASDGSVPVAPLGSSEIVWALDQIATRHPEGKAVIVAQGATGMAAREYAENLASVPQADRADVVGLVLLGTPNNGLSLPSRYPQAGIWTPFAGGAGLSAVDLYPGSTYVARLNRGRLPAVAKTLVVEGATATFHDQQTDGVLVLGESRLATTVASGPVDHIQVACAATQARALAQDWSMYVNMVNGDSAELPANEVAKLSTMGYAAAPEVGAGVQTFYTAWFANGAPTTHISSRMVLDVSGSMREQIGPVTKLAGAQQAARGFVDALDSRVKLPTSIPEDLGLIVFNTAAREVAPAGASPAKVRDAIGGLAATGNTDVGLALKTAIASFRASPRAADRVVVFLSDGVSTAGPDKSAVLAGPVADAKKKGIRINTIALGGTVGEADVAFLKSISKNTGGLYTQARNVYELRRDFLRARYASLGELSVDEEVALTGPVTVPLGTADAKARLIEVGIVPDSKGATWKVTRDGSDLPKGAATVVVNSDGTVIVQIPSPQAGVYSLQLVGANGSTKAHVFGVMQKDAFARVLSERPADNSAQLLLIGGGVVALLLIVATVVMSRRKPTVPRPESDPFLDVPPAEGGE